MKKILFISLLVTFVLNTVPAVSQQVKSFYDFTVKDIDGKSINLSTFKGKKVLVVNTASKCGFTPQYADLEKLFKEYEHKNFVVIGFPANNFMKQEPGTNEEIKNFCQVNYGVSFPMMSKISVKGEDMDPLYKWLTTKALNGVMDSEVSWNFQKYMIDENGRLAGMVEPKEKPNSEKIINWINN